MDNSNLDAKVAIRKHFLSLVEKPVVLECFGGEERKIYNMCYTDFDTTSLELKKTKGTMSIDNKKFIASADLTKYNYFDLDAYGSPYELMINIIKRKTGKYALILTDGIHRKMIYGECPKLIQFAMNNKAQIKIPTLHLHHNFIIRLLIKKICDKYNTSITEAKITTDEKSKMLYIGLLCESKPDQKHTQ